ncbi:hypothetical protein LXL04_009202 [Taraxacum kok-saghyz]
MNDSSSYARTEGNSEPVQESFGVDASMLFPSMVNSEPEERERGLGNQSLPSCDVCHKAKQTRDQHIDVFVFMSDNGTKFVNKGFASFFYLLKWNNESSNMCLYSSKAWSSQKEAYASACRVPSISKWDTFRALGRQQPI